MAQFNLFSGSSFTERYWFEVMSAAATILVLIYVRKLAKTRLLTSKPSSKLKREDLSSDEGEQWVKEDNGLLPALPANLHHIPFKGVGPGIKGGAAEFYKLMNARRSVRKYSSKAVDISIIKDIIHTAGTAPSGAHTEPWTFVAVKSLEVKQSIREIIEREEKLNYLQRMSRQWCADLTPLRTNWEKEYLTVAPWLILLFRKTHDRRESGARKEHYYHETSAAIAAGFMLAAVQSAGLCSLITTPLNCGPQLRRLLQRPDNEKLLILAPIGHPHEDCTVPDLKRKPLEEIMVVI